MSGGVDSAVALLKRWMPAPAGRRDAAALDRSRPDPRPSACCSPEAVLAARATCHRLGLPARDARSAGGVPQRGRRALRAGLRARRDAEPVHPLQRQLPLRRALAFARRVGAAQLVTGHYARSPSTRAACSSRAAPIPPRTSRTCSAASIRGSFRALVPARRPDKEETRAEAAAAGLEAADRPESQEACFLAGADYRDFLARQGLESARGGRRRGRPRARAPRGVLALHARPAQGASASPPAGRSTRSAPIHARTRSSSARANRSPPRGARPEPGASSSRPSAWRRSSATARPRRATVSAEARGFRITLDEPAYGVAVGQAAVLYEGDAVVGAGLITPPR